MYIIVFHSSLYSQLAQKVPLEVNPHTYDSSHTKTHILLQCHFGQLPLPSTDYNTDTKSVLDQAIRILQVSFYCNVYMCNKVQNFIGLQWVNVCHPHREFEI